MVCFSCVFGVCVILALAICCCAGLPALIFCCCKLLVMVLVILGFYVICFAGWFGGLDWFVCCLVFVS